MSLARGKFGIEYNPKHQERDASGFGWVILVAVLAALVTAGWTLARRLRAHTDEAAQTVEAVREPLPRKTKATEAALPQTSQTFQSFKPLNSELVKRPPKVRNLLMRMDEAVKRRDVEMAVSTIETLRALPGSPAADIDDSLARRLGALNIQRLFDLRNPQWVKSVTVGRGDSATRIASENGSTFASLARLNGGREKVEKIVIGRTLFVMNHPRFNLVLHKRTQTADLSLNGKFFKRYDLSAAPKAREGAYEMPEKRRLFWNGIGSVFRPEDRAELDDLLPKSTPILVSEL